MCGIAGVVDAGAATGGDALRAAATAMASAVAHRGPDDAGVWVDPAAGVAFGHRRLSIIDLSAEGHQPMVSAGGRYVIAFNGEIYNYRELRAELAAAGRRFHGSSDTEVLLEAIDRWGVVAAMQRTNGMAAVAVWDRAERVLHLARDRFGEKPLYVGRFSHDGRDVLLFGSELRALRAHPAFRGEVDRDAVALFLRHSYIPAPHAVYRHVRKVRPGTVLSWHVPGGATVLPEPVETVYWSALEVASRAASDRAGAPRDLDGAADEVDRLLRRSVELRMVSDVPIGAFLSGGIDSSTVVALMQAQSTSPVRTFTIGFDDDEFNEAEHGKGVAAHLGTDHTELYVTAADALAVIPQLPSLYDEPFADSSQIPTHLVSRMAREHVTVSLSGDGGDELFCGYNRYALLGSLWDRVSWVPRPVRAAAGRALLAVPEGPLDTAVRPLARLLPPGARRNPSAKVHKLARVLDARDPGAVYDRLTSLWPDPTLLVPGAVEPPTALSLGLGAHRVPTAVEAAMALDTVSYLPDDILVKVDRAAMAVGLETRVPFLDPNVFELAWRLPLAVKLQGELGKVVLRRVLERYVPPDLWDRPKWGFGMPLGSWLRGSLRGWAADLLSPASLARSGLFDPRVAQDTWREHQSGRSDRSHELWNVLVFAQWLEAERRSAPATAAR